MPLAGNRLLSAYPFGLNSLSFNNSSNISFPILPLFWVGLQGKIRRFRLRRGYGGQAWLVNEIAQCPQGKLPEAAMKKKRKV